jgi:hypothetical protein
VRLHYRILTWAVAAFYVYLIAISFFWVDSFKYEGRERVGHEILVDAALALGVGVGSQLGLILAPVAASHGVTGRSLVTALMVPSFLLGIATLVGDVLAVANARGGALSLAFTFRPYFDMLAPIYAVVLLRLWPRKGHCDLSTRTA